MPSDSLDLVGLASPVGMACFTCMAGSTSRASLACTTSCPTGPEGQVSPAYQPGSSDLPGPTCPVGLGGPAGLADPAGPTYLAGSAAEQAWHRRSNQLRKFSIGLRIQNRALLLSFVPTYHNVTILHPTV